MTDERGMPQYDGMEYEELVAAAQFLWMENAKLREQLEHLQPIDCEGNVLDIADKVNMLRSEYDGDHEWDDVVVELALAKWGGDRWIVRGSKGEAWACDCEKTGYDEDAYENSDDVEPIENPTLIEDENAKLRESVRNLLICIKHEECEESCPNYESTYTDYEYERNGSTVVESEYLGCCTVGLENCNSMFFDTDEYLRELGIEVDE